MGCFNQKGTRVNHIDEAEYRGSQSPAWKDKKYSLVEYRVHQVNMIKPKPESPPKKNSLSPTSYEGLDSFKKTQTRRLNGFISKYQLDNYVTQHVKRNQWKPPAGIYEVDKGKNFVTKGLSKGWK